MIKCTTPVSVHPSVILCNLLNKVLSAWDSTILTETCLFHIAFSQLTFFSNKTNFKIAYCFQIVIVASHLWCGPLLRAGKLQGKLTLISWVGQAWLGQEASSPSNRVPNSNYRQDCNRLTIFAVQKTAELFKDWWSPLSL